MEKAQYGIKALSLSINHSDYRVPASVYTEMHAQRAARQMNSVPGATHYFQVIHI